MPAPLGITSANTCSPVPERASRDGLGEGTIQFLLKGLAPVCASVQEGHVVIEHGRNAGRRLLNSAALVAPILEEGRGELTMGSFSSHETDGFILLKNLSLIHISEPTRRTPISYAVFCLKKKN